MQQNDRGQPFMRTTHPPSEEASTSRVSPMESATIESAEDSLASELKRRWKLETFIAWLTIAKEASDIPPISYLKGCVGLALSIAENFQTARTNSEDCESLIKKMAELMAIMLDKGRRRILSSTPAQEVIQQTYESLRELEPFIVKLSKKRPMIKGFFMASADKKNIAKHQEKFDNIIKFFQTKALAEVLDFISAQNENDYKNLTEDDVHLIRRWPQLCNGWKVYNASQTSGSRAPVLLLKQIGDRNAHADKEFLRVLHEFRKNWEPNVPQLIGATRFTVDNRFIALRGPQGDGRVATYIAYLTTMQPLQASRKLIALLQGLVSGATYSLESTQGKWGLTDYDVYIGEREQLVVYNLALILDPETSGPPLLLKDWRHWDAFIRLFTMVLTNNVHQLNHVRGQLDAAKIKIMRLVKHLVSFAWDYTNTIGDRIRHNSKAAVTMMLESFEESLSKVAMCLEELEECDPHPLLTALVEVYGEKLSGIWDFDTPQDVTTGDIGYMTGTTTEPKFERLGSVATKISDISIQERPYQALQYRPWNRYWSEEIVDGVVRHKCCITNTPTNDTLFRVERGHRSGRLDESLYEGRMRWDCSRTWNYMLKNKLELLQEFGTEESLQEHELMLIFSHKQSQGHGFIRLISSSLTQEERKAAFQNEGFDGENIYFFENPNPRKGELWGYFSSEANPGHPIWPPSIDAKGQPWAWDARTEFCRVEVSRVGPQQHIRYMHG